MSGTQRGVPLLTAAQDRALRRLGVQGPGLAHLAIVVKVHTGLV